MESFRRVKLPAGVPGRLYLHSMPGRYEAFEDFLSEARRVALDVVVCLASDQEIRIRYPDYFAARSAGTTPFRRLDFPIPDYGIPPEEERWRFQELVRAVCEELRSARNVLVHCHMGIGRTGTLASCVLLELGMETGRAIDRVKRAGSGAHVADQVELILWYSGLVRHG